MGKIMQTQKQTKNGIKKGREETKERYYTQNHNEAKRIYTLGITIFTLFVVSVFMSISDLSLLIIYSF